MPSALPPDGGGPDYYQQKADKTMKYMITWNERPQGTPIEYENAQKRILEVFSPWKAPANFKIEAFVIRVGDWGGYMLMECDDPLEVHKFCSMLPAFTFEARPVVPVADAIRVELEQRLQSATRQGCKVIVVRAGDFFGPQPGNSWFSQGLLKPGQPVKAVNLPGMPGVGHQWSYLLVLFRPFRQSLLWSAGYLR